MTVDEIRTKYGATQGATAGSAPPIIPFSISVEALEGCGKTQFGLLTCPWPIVHVNFGDRDAKAFLYEMPPERRAHTTMYSFAPASPGGWTRPEATLSLTALREIAKNELDAGKLAGGTFILDSGSSWWDVVQEVYVAPLAEAREAAGEKRTGGLIYSQGNLIVSGVVSWIKNQGCFFVLTHQKSQQWDSKGPIPGAYKARINPKVPYLVEVRLDLRKECLACGGADCQSVGHMGRKHTGRLTKFAKNTVMEGMEFYNEQITFANIYRLYAGGDFPDAERLT